MTDNEHDVLARRIKAAQDAHGVHVETRDSTPESPVNAGNMVIRHGSELFANVIVGLVLGLTIDYFLGTRPWGTLIMLALGLAAGFLGVIRAYKQITAEYAESPQHEVDRD